jgi:hypothetical protein
LDLEKNYKATRSGNEKTYSKLTYVIDRGAIWNEKLL